MEQLMELFLKNGLRPFQLDCDFIELENKLTPSELSALLVLDFYGELSMSEIAHHLGSPMSTLTNMVHRLQKRNYIERYRDARDGRVYRVMLASDGKEIVQVAKKRINLMISKINEVLTPEEYEQFLTLALKVGKAIQQQPLQENIERSRSTVRKIKIEE